LEPVLELTLYTKLASHFRVLGLKQMKPQFIVTRICGQPRLIDFGTSPPNLCLRTFNEKVLSVFSTGHPEKSLSEVSRAQGTNTTGLTPYSAPAKNKNPWCDQQEKVFTLDDSLVSQLELMRSFSVLLVHSLSISLQKRADLQETTTKHNKTRYNTTDKNPHVNTGQDNPTGGKESKSSLLEGFLRLHQTVKRNITRETFKTSKLKVGVGGETSKV
ncbi:hypothetical protein STEG23_020548, partial [Scotinomys teguina]